MKKKKAFTLVELLVVIVLLAVVLILVAPNIVNMSKSSKISLHESKIKTLETAAEKYGNSLINDYQECVRGSSGLKSKCIVSIAELIRRGYITGDENESLIDPETSEPFDGSMLLCYNPIEVNIYAKYLKKDEVELNRNEVPQCMEINVTAESSLTLNPISGEGYNGGEDDIYVKIFKSRLDSVQCKSDNPSYVSCEIEGSKLKLSIKKDESFKEGSRTVKIDVFVPKNEDIKQTFTLEVFPTDIKINEEEGHSECLKSGDSEELKITGTKYGKLDIKTKEDTLKATIKNNDTLILNGGNNTGEVKLTLTEGNGNAKSEITRRVYKLELDKEIPHGMLLGKKETFNINYGGNDSVTIKTEPDKSDIIKFSKGSSDTYEGSITLDGTDNSFSIIALQNGTAKITIEGKRCGKIEYNVSISNLYLEETEAELFIGGATFETKAVAGSTDTFTCSSSDEEAVQCSVNGNKITLTPKTKPTENATITVKGSNGGQDTISVTVKDTSFRLLNESGTSIARVCSDYEAGNDAKITVAGSNLGTLSVDNISDQQLVNAIIKDGRLVLTNKIIGSTSGLESYYKTGINTGITKVRIKEANGNNTAELDYYVYKLNTEGGNYFRVSSNTTSEIKIKSSTTGPLTVISTNPDVASVTIENPSYDYNVNAENESIIRITGNSLGSTEVIVTGSYCGALVLSIDVVGQELYINLEKGTYTNDIPNPNDKDFSCTKTNENQYCEQARLSCATVGSDKSCTVKLPSFNTSSVFEVGGYSSFKDAASPQYQVEDTFTISASNNGSTLYANSIDVTPPKCIFLENITTVPLGKTDYFTLSCYEPASGSDSKLTPSSFTISDTSVAEIVSVSDPMETIDEEFGRAGYTYRVGITGKSMIGNFDLTLKENQVVDKFNNGNEELKVKSIFAAEYKGYKHWYIGENDPNDVTAILYINKDMPEEIKGDDPDDTYTLILYGSGTTKSFSDSDVLDIPWIKEGYQEYITNVIINDGITSIGDNLLQSLYNMTRITLADSIETIGVGAFLKSISLESITLPAELETIESNAFENCSKLTNVTFNSKLQSIGNSAFLNHGIKEIFIPKSVTHIGYLAFKSSEDNMKLEKLEFESGIQLESIGNNAFENHQIKTLTIPKSLRTIGNYTFAQYSMSTGTLKDLNFEEGSNLEIIGYLTFFCCPLTHLELPDSIVAISMNAFAGVGEELTTLRIGPNVESIGVGFIIGENIKEFIVDENNSHYTTHEGVLYTKNMNTLVRFPDAYHVEHNSYTIPEGVKTIENSAFGGLTYLTDYKEFTLSFPNSIEEINASSNFNGSIISKFIINNDTYTSVDGVIFSENMEVAYKMPTLIDLNEYTIPSSVRKINGLFAYCNQTVKKITIPDSVESIDSLAFATDPNVAFSTVNLYVNAETNLINSFMTNIVLKSGGTPKRTVNVKNAAIRTIIEGYYGSSVDVVLEEE